MKSNAQPRYFSAYPLKAIQQSDNKKTDSPYLKAVLEGTPAVASPGRIRVLPMSNPYPLPSRSTGRLKLRADIETGDNGWFGNYE